MTAKVLFAGCRDLPEGTGDEHGAAKVLAEAGAEVRWAVWDDPQAPFADADLVVLRATWDYPERHGEFLAWCESVPCLRNSAAVVRWNTDKRYLLDLAAAGVPVVPTDVVVPGAEVHWPDGEFVVKPAVGAGSRGARRFGADDRMRAAAHLRALHDGGRPALVQPYQADVDTNGETALVFVGGVYSHAFTKAAMLTGPEGDAAGPTGAEKRTAADPEPEQRAAAEETLDAATGLLGMTRGDLLYARVDVVTGHDGVPLLLELELTEPYLGFAHAEGAAVSRFASAVRAQLG
ncbi:hypothetical protein SAXI111661_19640 [Saccharomonospora xinjiangensis]|uniref:ATP-grasp domain-containing protein n=1 Tax=Saccharomonospora xinjiangensis TaxID=75294 RepID=UPI0010706013|nr:hypothetical protein [Saccharomonospora xinjiangensis]QBQ60187.1 Cycloserine biosynthesis protein DcsG [Saccharomonospora xinjiangensis]